MMACTVRTPSTLRKTRSSSGARRIRPVERRGAAAPLGAAAVGARPAPTSISAGSTTGRNTMSKEGIFFSMIGHSSTIRIPSIRMKSVLMGAKFSRS